MRQIERRMGMEAVQHHLQPCHNQWSWTMPAPRYLKLMHIYTTPTAFFVYTFHEEDYPPPPFGCELAHSMKGIALGFHVRHGAP